MSTAGETRVRVKPGSGASRSIRVEWHWPVTGGAPAGADGVVVRPRCGS